MSTNPFYRTTPKRIYIPSRSGRMGTGSWIDEPDPFGRLFEPSHEPQLDVSDPFSLTAAVGRQGRNNREDVGKIECLLKLAGVWDLDPTDGPTGYYGTRLGEAVKAFQETRGLKVDGDVKPNGETLRALGKTLQNMGRNGDTVLAHLTPEEARFLHDITDGGSINPQTGLMEFWNGDLESEVEHGFGDSNDAQAAENDAQGTAFASARAGDPAGYGDMAPVNAANAAHAGSIAVARAAAQAQAQKEERERAERQRAEEQARLDRQARLARQREQKARYEDLQNRRIKGNKDHDRLSGPVNPDYSPVNFLEDDNDAQPGSGLSGFNDDQAAENEQQVQENAFASAKKGDPAGYGDMKPVEAVNKDRKDRAVSSLYVRLRNQKDSLLEPIPDNKRQLITLEEWVNFYQALRNLSKITDKEVRALMGIFAREGGLRSSRGSSTFAGITQRTLDNLIEAGYVTGISKVTKAGSLTVGQVAQVYDAYFNEVFNAKTLGPDVVISKVSDPLAANTLWDGLFSHGPIPTGLAVQQAINAIQPGTIEDPKGVVGSTTLKEFDKLTSNPKTRNAILNKLADFRLEIINNSANIPQNHKPGWRERINSMRP